MTYNRHGHHIQGTPTADEIEKPKQVVICSGTPHCLTCAYDAKVYAVAAWPVGVS